MSLDTSLQGVIDDAATASASLATILAGSDAVVANFSGLKDLVDSLSAFASTMKDGVFYTPTGSIMPFVGVSAPTDWYLCNGSSFVSHGLGVGDALYDLLVGAGWSALPDLRGRTIVGVGSNDGVTGVLGQVQGVSGTVLDVNHIPSHYHGDGSLVADATGSWVHGHSINDPGHAHNYSALQYQGADTASGTARGRYGSPSAAGTTGSGTGISINGTDLNHGHGVSGNTGSWGNGSSSVSAVQPSLGINYIIKG